MHLFYIHPGILYLVAFSRHRHRSHGPTLCFTARRLIKECIDITTSLHYSIIMRTTVTLDDDVFQAAQSLARASGRRLGQVLSELVRRTLKSEGRDFARQGDLPAFKVRPDAEIIPASRAAELMANEPK